MLLRTSSESNLRPIRRFTAKTVASGLVIAWRLAICPTRRSPASVKPTIDGVVRLPSELGITTGSPPSITTTQLLVVPRSMPMTLGIEGALPRPFYLKGPRGRNFGGSPAWEDSALSPTLAVRRRSGLRGSTRLCHHHRGGTDQPIIELVSPGHLRHDRAGGLVALLLHERLVQAGIERLSQGGEPDHAVFGERRFEQLLHQAHSFDDLSQIVLLGVIEGALEIVHHRQEVLQQALDAEPLYVLLLLHRALLEVVELRRRAQQTLVRILQALRRLSRALERLFQLRLQHGQLLRVGGCAAGVAAALRHRPLLVHRGARRDLGIVWNQVISSKRGGNIAQRSASPRGV